MIKKNDEIMLNMNIPGYKLLKGALGKVIFIHNEGEEFDIEFRNIVGELLVVIRLIPTQFQKLNIIQVPQVKKFNLN
ncbi:MAG TPA: DUF4926 domain-containing protein [Ignavibacteriaceae bacterium]|nr:DUF4926 domain-containing protein [Ignavibacteriaceae bacterium]